MIILGIDPGMASTGYGIIKKIKIKNKKSKIVHLSHGVIKTPVGRGVGKRLRELRLKLRKIIRQFYPDCMVIEQHFFGKNSKTAMVVGQARGVILMTAAEFKLPTFEYQSLAVKKLLTNNGRAEKMEIQRKVQRILKMKAHPTPDDAADALAIAICHGLKVASLVQ